MASRWRRAEPVHSGADETLQHVGDLGAVRAAEAPGASRL